MLEIERIDMRRSALMRVSGRIDSSTASTFEEELMAAVDDKGNVVVNLAEVEFLSSAAIRALIAALKETRERTINRGDLVLTNVPTRLKEVFDLAAITSLFTFYEEEVYAVGAF
ncbi:MAG: STAS domain-containing protein [Anaerolineales bacterium]|nr:STAS domain-containing protein [Anaerolineales bacterium]MCB9127752.1 STAS domain-containing protein [Ardenticatenales bacterium]